MPIVGKKTLQGKQAKRLATALKFRKRRYSLLVQRAKDCICCLVLAGVLKVSMHRPALKDICHYCSTVRPKATTFQLLNQLQFISGHLEVYSSALDLPIRARTIEFHISTGSIQILLYVHGVPWSNAVHSLCGGLWQPWNQSSENYNHWLITAVICNKYQVGARHFVRSCVHILIHEVVRCGVQN